jgi:cell division protein ZapA (FtsZ GTPase activity inhibitor)
MSATVKVHLLGRDYLLRSQGDPDLVQEAAVLVEEKLSGLPKSVSVDTRDRYMLAMLNLAGEYLQEKRKNQEIEVERHEWLTNPAVDALSKSREVELIERIENALNE